MPRTISKLPACHAVDGTKNESASVDGIQREMAAINRVRALVIAARNPGRRIGSDLYRRDFVRVGYHISGFHSDCRARWAGVFRRFIGYIGVRFQSDFRLSP